MTGYRGTRLDTLVPRRCRAPCCLTAHRTAKASAFAAPRLFDLLLRSFASRLVRMRFANILISASRTISVDENSGARQYRSPEHCLLGYCRLRATPLPSALGGVYEKQCNPFCNVNV